ncbi:MAG: YihY/virulence factor BrkB family protein [Bradymonadaceae bacterium]
MVSTEEAKSMGQDIWQNWKEDDAGTLAASVAFYAVFSLAPLLVLAVAIAGLIFGEQAAQGELAAQMEQWVGSAGAEAAQGVIASAGQPGGGGIFGTIFSIAVLLYAASKIFTQLHKSLNRIWDVRTDPDVGIRGTIRKHITGFAMVLGIGILLVALIILSGFLANLEAFVGDVPGGEGTWMVLNFIVQGAILTFIFAAIFKYVPEVEVEWSDVWLGGAVTAVLFVIGSIALSFYLAQAGPASAYGAAGSLVALLLWIFYSTQILFAGAEFTQVYTRHRGRRIEPSEHAVPEKEAFSGGEQPPQPAPS